ncbi:MAG: (Fe-S)-binding protein [Candidatus Methylomirabilia bacterium]
MEVTRQVWWNVPTWLAFALYLGSALTIGFSAWVALEHARRWLRGRAPTRGHPLLLGRSLLRLLVEVFGHRHLFQDRAGAWVHLLIFYGFATLFVGTGMVFVHDKLVPFLSGKTYLVFSLILDLSGLAFIFGIGWAFAQRFSLKLPRLERSPEAFWVLILLGAIGVSGFLLEAARIAATRPDFEVWSLVGWTLAQVMVALGLPAETFHRSLWGLHAALSCAFFGLVMITFLRHMVTGPAQLLLRELRPVGALTPAPADGRLGPLAPEALTWAQLLDASACVRCGRCTAVCPATAAGKALDPRLIVQKTLRAMLDARPLEQLVSPEEVWACTTCAACVHACPFQIEVLDKLVDLRRLWVERGAIDPSGARMLEAILERGNTWGAPPSQRMDWAEGLQVRVLRPGDEVEFVYWVGCAGAFDPSGRRVARSVVQLLQRAGAEFGVLGLAESCTGDPARRMGEEGLFREAAGHAIETLSRVRFRQLLTHCAHCFHVFRSEYPALGARYDTVHHSQLLAELVRTDRLSPVLAPGATVAFHDPCYLGRHNGEYDAARAVLAKLPGVVPVEMPRTRDRSFCCGAGGGGNWIEIRQGQRIATVRMAEAHATGASVVATACPFCTIMLEGETAGQGMVVRDVAELLLESQLP